MRLSSGTNLAATVALPEANMPRLLMRTIGVGGVQ